MMGSKFNIKSELSGLSGIIHSNQRPSILIISGNLKTSDLIRSSLSHIDLNLYFTENRELASSFMETHQDINIILFDISYDETAHPDKQNPVSDDYFNLYNIPVILIVSDDRIEKTLDLFSENVIDYMAFPMSETDFLARIKLHLSVLVTNKEMKHLTLQLHTILEGTRNIVKTRDPLTAATVASAFILRLAAIPDASLMTIYLPRSSFQNDDSFISHQPIDGFNLLTSPSEKPVMDFRECKLVDINETAFLHETLMIPVIDESETLAILQFAGIPESLLKTHTRNYISGIVDSLSIVLKNFRHEDHSRLAHIGQMAATIIHDLKNYTVVIRNSARLALDDSLSSKEKFQFLNNISYESERMVEMTHDILDFSRGEISIMMIKIDAKKYIFRLKQFLTPLCEESKINLSIKGNIEDFITIDPDRLQRAIFNIAVNACDSMENNPPEKRNLSLNIYRQGAILHINVADTGKGIPTDIRDKIFEPFITGKKHNGTGLGMSIAHSIITAHGGKIDFQTSVNTGTTFHIQIPQRISII